MKVTGSSIQQLEKDKPRSRCRRWRLWASTEQGRKSKRFNGTYSQAQDALKAFVAELGQLVSNPGSFGAYAASWASWRAKTGDFSPNTVKSEGYAVSMLRRTGLDGMRMDEVTPADCREALQWLRENPKKGTELKPSTVGKAYQVLNAILSQAEDDGEIARNPMSSVKRPKQRTEEREALSPDELQLFLNRVDELPLDGRVMALYMMACLGLRRGEACAIRDDQVGAFAQVDSTVRAADGSVGPPKSDAGKRELPMPPRLAAKVAEWRALRDSLGLHDAPTLCCNMHGGLMTANALGNWWISIRDGIGCDGMTLHQLRHSNLSMMARHMSVFDLQRYAGWASIAPAKVYVHEDRDAVARAVEMAWK